MTRVRIKVIPNAKENKLIEEDGKIRAYLKAKPIHGKANKALIEALSEHFKVKKGNIKIISGKRSREKVIEVC